jgi:bifunctional non-homologous end joining protein LigD
MVQHDVWTIAKTVAHHLAGQHPKLLTAEYTIAKRPKKRVLLDYNQNAWGRTLASVYSVRPTSTATVSMPIHWDELEAGARIEDFTLHKAPARLKDKGDLWAPMAPAAKRRFDLTRLA